MDTFTEAYIECALWASGTYIDCHGKACDDDGEEAEYFNFDDMDADLTEEALATMGADCRDFQAANAADLEEYCQHRSVAHAGHDFWLTRNGHGAGFWDRGLGDLGERLTVASKPYGSCDLYLGDDGKIYLA